MGPYSYSMNSNPKSKTFFSNYKKSTPDFLVAAQRGRLILFGTQG